MRDIARDCQSGEGRQLRIRLVIADQIASEPIQGAQNADGQLNHQLSPYHRAALATLALIALDLDDSTRELRQAGGLEDRERS